MTNTKTVPVVTGDMVNAAWTELMCATEINHASIEMAIRSAIKAAPHNTQIDRAVELLKRAKLKLWSLECDYTALGIVSDIEQFIAEVEGE